MPIAPAVLDDSDLLPISAVQHYVYCPRQCALIHLERAWADNRFTAEGNVLHARVDEPGHERRRGVRTVTAMPIRSLGLGLAGIADLVELHEADGRLRPVPIDVKRGKPKSHRADEVQLCAQGLALEEMFGVAVPEGALFYAQTRRRTPVRFDEPLRALTRQAAAGVHALFANGLTPPPVYERAKCRGCSLIDLCRPERLGRPDRTETWLAQAIAMGDEPA